MMNEFVSVKSKYSLVLIFLFLSLWLVVFPIKDYDTFWHLANGLAMIEQGRIVHEEIFSYSAYGVKFLNHSWLAQIIMGSVYLISDINGLIFFKLLLTFAIFWFVFKASRNFGVSIALSGIVGYLSILVGLSRYVVRPQLFSYLGLALLVCVLFGYLKGFYKDKLLWMLPLVIVVWDFMHGAIFGLVFWGALATGESLKLLLPSSLKKWQEPFINNRRRVVHLWVWLGVSVACALLNPGGFERYIATIKTVSGNYILHMTGEFLPTSLGLLFYPYWFLLTAVIFSFVFNWRRVDLSHIFVLVPFVYLSIRYNRAVAVFGIVSAPIFALYVTQLLNTYFTKEKFNTIATILTSVVLLLSLLWTVNLKGTSFSNSGLDSSGMKTGFGINKAFLPLGAIDFIKTANLKGNMYNNDRWGGLLAFYLYPERKIFHYNHPLIFQDIYSYLHNPDERNKWHHNYALIATPEEHEMFKDMKWITVYRDAVSFIMVPRNSTNKIVINKYMVRFFHPLMDEKEFGLYIKHPPTAKIFLKETSNYLKFNADKMFSDLLAEGIEMQSHIFTREERENLISNALRRNPDNSNLLLLSKEIIGNY